MIKADGLRGAAYHEAGHAVVALALGLRVERVEIFDEDNSGSADVEPAKHLPLVDRLAICLAGINANHMFKAPMHELAGFQDHVMVRKLVSDIPETEGDILRDKGHQRAWDLLKAHARSVEDIAAQLLAQRKIDLTGYALESA
jgi:ATP-dependent Zn protease